MNETAEFIRVEALFNSVEGALARQWASHNVPSHFATRPLDHLRQVVKAWWHIYHESICAGKAVDRSIWERRADYPAEVLDTASLVESLEKIHRLINLGGLLSFRPLHTQEVAAICLLANMASFYINCKPIDSLFVIFAPMEERPLELTNNQLKAITLHYMAIMTKATELLPTADPRLLTGSVGTTYLKQKGHRALSGDDSENIIQSLGTNDDKATIDEFKQAQVALSNQLKKSKWIGLIAELSKIPYLTIYRRIKKPKSWKAEEVIQIADALEKIQN